MAAIGGVGFPGPASLGGAGTAGAIGTAGPSGMGMEQPSKEICDVVAANSSIDPATASPETVQAEYQRIYDHALLVLGNRVAQDLKLPEFPDANAVRVWFSDEANEDSCLRLIQLNISDTMLGVLPREVRKLRNLAVLIARKNNLTSLPSDLGQLKKLTHLFLDNNRLKSLPPALVQCTILRDLILNDNNITRLPKGFERLDRVNLHLKNNPLISLSPSLKWFIFRGLSREKVAELQAAWVEEEEDGGGWHRRASGPVGLIRS